MRFKTILCIGLISFAFACQNKPENKPSLTANKTEVDNSVDLSGMSNLHQYTQHLIINLPLESQNNIDSLVNWVNVNQPGGLIVNNWNLDSVKTLTKALSGLPIIQPFIIDDFWARLESKPYAFTTANPKLIDNKYAKYFENSGVSLVNYANLNPQLKTNAQSIDFKFVIHNLSHKLSKKIKAIKNSSFNIWIDLSVIHKFDIKKYKQLFNLKGLIIAKSKKANDALNLSADLVIQNDFEIDNTQFKITDNFKKSTQHILKLKKSISYRTSASSSEALKKYTQYNFQQKASCILKNKKQLIPVESVKQYKLKEYTVKSLSVILNKTKPKYIILPDTLKAKDVQILDKIKTKDNLIIVFSNPVYYSILKKVPYLVFVPPFKTINIQILEEQLKGKLPLEGDFVYKDKVIKCIKTESSQLATTPAEYVGIDSKKLRKINYLVNETIRGRAFPGCQVIGVKNGSIIYNQSFGYHTYDKKIKVKQNSVYDIASLTKIVSTTLMAMKLYEQNKFKLNDSLHQYLPDSLTKILGKKSTLSNITFQELLIHKSGLPSGFPIYKFLKYTTDSIGRFDKYYCDMPDEIYNTEVAKNYYLEQAYQDSMWLTLNQITLNQSKPYKYSDVNMNTLYFMLKSMIHNSPSTYGFKGSKKANQTKNLYVNYLYKTFYRALNMTSTYYQPTKHIKLNRLVPTEKETFWRKQLLQGFVHDPNSALHGGIAGNAGIFTTTNDLVLLLQMLLNEGVYDNKRYLEAETIQKFITTQPNSHRGLGFNKRTMTNSAYAMADSASVNTYGHTGFTGTCFWIDPDTEIIYVFLANRVHPKVSNKMYQYGIRKAIHQVFYDALLE